MRRSAKDRSRVKTVAIALWISAAVAFLIWTQAGVDATEIPVQDQCQGNVQSLYEALRRFDAGGLEAVPRSLGSSFWKAIAERESTMPALECPCAKRSGSKRSVHYRGPVKPWSELPETAVILADVPDNHPDGMWILQKNGEIRFAPVTTPAYQRALAETRE